MRNPLPVADQRQILQFVRAAVRVDRTNICVILVLYVAAAAAGLVIPPLIGNIVAEVGRHAGVAAVDRDVALAGLFLLVQVVLTRYAQLRSLTLGEKVLAHLRERFVAEALRLPMSTIEDAGSGDLITRASRDIDAMARSVRFAVPATVVAIITLVSTVVAALFVGGWVAIPIVLGVPVIWVTTRWYLRRSRRGYLRAGATYSDITGTVLETMEGARTVEAFDLGAVRAARLRDRVDRSLEAEQFNTRSRMVFFGATEFGYVIPLVAAVVLGGLLYRRGDVSLAAVTTVLLYLQRLVDPLDQILGWLDELQSGGASMSRVVGVAGSAMAGTSTAGMTKPVGGGADPSTSDIGAGTVSVTGSARLVDVHFAYPGGQEVLHGLHLDLANGERIAVVGPSGAGKTTVARLLAGLAQSTAGRVELGGVGIHELDPSALRRQVALVSQENHVFMGSLRDNLCMASGGDVDDTHLWQALDAVGASGWAQELPQRLETSVGVCGETLTDTQAQQIALARVILADPGIVILDEATSRIDPREGRTLERSMARLMEGRTVVAIAHRLFTAHDADRVAVVDQGSIAEIGTHDELLALNGSYAALWGAWSQSAINESR